MNSSQYLQETRKLKTFKRFEDLTEEQRIKLENDLVFRFLERNNRKLYSDIFKGRMSEQSGVWLGSRIWKGTGPVPRKYEKEMTHFREVLTRLKNASFTVDPEGKVQFDMEKILAETVNPSNKSGDLTTIPENERERIRKDLNNFDPSDIFGDDADQVTRPLNKVS
jgi:hypothetical protein